MPSQQEVRWSQLKVGVIVMVSAVILVSLLFLMTSASGLGLFSKKLTVMVYFENAGGLKEGGGVNLQGVTIGSVKSVAIVSDPARKLTPVRVVLKIDGRYSPDLRQDSKASLTTVGVLGDTVIDINSQTAIGAPLRDGDELHTSQNPSISDVVKASQGTVESLNVILAKLNATVDDLQKGKGTVGQLISNPELYNKLTATVDQLNMLEKNLNNGRGSVGKFLTDDSVYNKLNDAATRMDNIAVSLDKGNGSAGKLLKDETLYNNLNTTLTHANTLMTQVEKGQGAVGMLINDPVFAQKLKDTVDETHLLLAGVRTGKGTLGKLATDDQAYVNLNHLLTETSGLMTTIRQDPKKYLTIHVKIF
ncbi:phospholipid/cholesterol/gamma-HCH transport system substrate-binding protein [Granulicella rosea]|uniref:Phospholipid/cholesterol/gamma-HCH transport system substrate-binding protein n=1 Tax=Granulicella rosea TaxID=474952 RepID=A0A239L6W8_9BACT|nr:MlaD family protein [Granulicella rosea]SNT26030.1 phospholipid/cholesterol/gamma-HCH transport system substrate-binding protein [Granulicella rosea]